MENAALRHQVRCRPDGRIQMCENNHLQIAPHGRSSCGMASFGNVMAEALGAAAATAAGVVLTRVAEVSRRVASD